jgi:hypothetical protein
MSRWRSGTRHEPLVEVYGVLHARRRLATFRLDILIQTYELQARLGEDASRSLIRFITPCGDSVCTQLVEAESHDLDGRLRGYATPQ